MPEDASYTVTESVCLGAECTYVLVEWRVRSLRRSFGTKGGRSQAREA